MQQVKESAVLGQMIPMLDFEWINYSTGSVNPIISLLEQLYIVHPSVSPSEQSLRIHCHCLDRLHIDNNSLLHTF